MQRKLLLDIGKMALAMMVEALHCGFLFDYSQLWHYLTVQGLFRIAVPTFLVINGFYFYHVVQKGGMERWLKHSVVLYLIWTAIYCPLWLFKEPLTASRIPELVEVLLFGHGHLWYLPAMIGAGTITCLLHNRPRLMGRMVLITFLLGILIQYGANYQLLKGTGLSYTIEPNDMHRNLLFLGFPFFALGYLINQGQWHTRINREITTYVVLLGLAMLMGESWLNYDNPRMSAGFDNYMSLIVLAPALFIWMIQSHKTTTGRYLGQQANALYLLHPLWIRLLTAEFSPNTVQLWITTLALSLVSAALLIVLNRRARILL